MLTSSQNTMKFMVYMHSPARLLLLAAISINTSVSYAEMYKWVDAEGNTNYTQTPPPGDIKATTISPPPKFNTEQATKQLENRQKHLQDARDGRLKAVDQKQKEKKEQDDKKAQCEKARASLASYQRPRVNKVDKDGNRIRVTEEQRQTDIASAKKQVADACDK